jgi:hypothetical protein
MALLAADTTVIEWDVTSGRIADPRAFARWLGLGDGTPFAGVADLLALVDPADADSLADKVNALMRGSPRCETVFRVINPSDGQTRWVLSRSTAGEDEGAQESEGGGGNRRSHERAFGTRWQGRNCPPARLL